MTPASRSASFFLMGWLAAMAATPAGAQAPAPTDARQPSRLTAYLYGKEQIGALYEVGRQWDRKLGLQQDARAPTTSSRRTLPAQAHRLPGRQNAPRRRRLAAPYVFERCGKRMTYNAVFVAQPGDKPEVRPHVPGNTNASALLVADTLRGAYPAALLRLAKRAKDCKEADLIDTRLTQQPRTSSAEADKGGGRWEEVWTFRGCGHDVELPITFTPDGKGGTHYAIKAAG